MRKLIRASFPSHAIFGEEGGLQAGEAAEVPAGSTDSFLWVLDPIDGTKSFITGVSQPGHAFAFNVLASCPPWPSVGLPTLIVTLAPPRSGSGMQGTHWPSQRTVCGAALCGHVGVRAATGKPVFGTLIALLQDGVPVLGIINQPITQERWLGVAGQQTTLNGELLAPCQPIKSHAATVFGPCARWCVGIMAQSSRAGGCMEGHGMGRRGTLQGGAAVVVFERRWRLLQGNLCAQGRAARCRGRTCTRRRPTCSVAQLRPLSTGSGTRCGWPTRVSAPA